MVDAPLARPHPAEGGRRLSLEAGSPPDRPRPDPRGSRPDRLGLDATEQLLIRALDAQEVAEAAGSLLALAPGRLTDGALELARAVDRACRSAAGESTIERDRVRAALARDGIDTTPAVPGDLPPRQLHAYELGCARADAERAIHALGALGYEPWVRLSGGAIRSHARTAGVIQLQADGPHPTRLTLRWAEPPSGRRATRAVPSTADHRFVDLPTSAWPLYRLVRLPRRAAERLRPPADHSIAPFLGTPHELTLPLLELAGVGADDLLVDIGCGDGRVLIAAAQSTGCRARGIERDPDLVERARRAARSAGVSARVDIEQGDARDADIADAAAVFLFLPPSAAREVLPRVLDHRRAETVVVSHEQSALDPPVPPSRQVLVVAGSSLTAASIWAPSPTPPGSIADLTGGSDRPGQAGAHGEPGDRRG